MRSERFRLVNPAVRARAQTAVGEADHGTEVIIKRPSRSLEQNARFWAMLNDIARAKPEGREHGPEVWKALFLHAFGHAVRFEASLVDGSPFPVGFQSSRLSVAQMSDLMEFISAWAAERGVEFSDNGWRE